ncbi:MAG: type II toxin-antitoxin system RelE/ParE family toxin [Moraxellaceae bacterium]|nr:type II toxin-antitoxin system RelE/ParE family toxin [Pseudobdellovibrionaceae bacterium]
MTGKYKVVVYQTATGREPFYEWLSSLDKSVEGRVQARIERLEWGNFGNAKALKSGLFEIKFRSPPFRIYYALVDKQIVLLVFGGDKSQQSDDIKKSKVYLRDYRSRYGIEKK